eukprot:Protomagalhaensia_sp_Gyna_25__5940@NODE_911_length_2431_cov_17_579013_g718_i0_p2_GENE_NODE_911_length_2431_cov_17_579013_g718_i0NODE_911_length_2431_cov_17_579013_g718_i0_p2_ORF_typecomplete_len259_score48_02DUF2040/PF09745_9/2_2e12PRODH/PF18327_1/8_3PRODH/PF18327_1/4_1PRODH/PF18327_1/1_1e04_NODE_911_length_2431_cov_17_579013_g718_i015791
MAFSLAINKKGKGRAQNPPPNVAAQFSSPSLQEEAGLYSFQPKAPSVPSSLFQTQALSTEDQAAVAALAAEFEGEPEGAALAQQKRRRLADEDPDESQLYEGGKFKMSKLDSKKAGLILMTDAPKAEPIRPSPQYVDKLLKSATLRGAEREIIHEAKLVKELEQEIGDKPVVSYVTTGYKRRLEERRKAAQLLAQRETEPPKTTTDFQRALYTRVLAAENPETSTGQPEAASAQPESHDRKSNSADGGVDVTDKPVNG